MSVHEVVSAMALLKCVWVPLPKQYLITLVIEWDVGVNAGVDKYTVFVNVH